MSAFFVQHPKETDLALFAGGELGPFARWRIERHLETCPECKQTVADFFHLSEELSPWPTFQKSTGRRWRVTSRRVWPWKSRSQPLHRQPSGPMDLATRRGRGLCALVAVVAFQLRPHAEKANSMVAEQVIAEKVAVAKEYASDKAPQAGAGAFEQFAETEQDAEVSQAAQMRALAEPAAPAPAAVANEAVANEAKKEAPVELAFADRQEARLDERLSTDAAAPPPPSQPAPAIAQSVSVAANRPGAQPGKGRPRLDLREWRLPLARSAAPARVRWAFSGMIGEARSSAALFTIEPLPAAGDDPRVGGDGWISVRAVSADGAMTITEVYDPQ
ncbi:MAG: zf-HC2 domain-containing protein [Bryobacterales bacterium]